ncbi:hypothetical protein L218DRAFT_261253 [Marasmius fiardii PR-910]|nr:hypothetical protein L218DRAFT_261253 [Marasmius fiardii PR-910]
METPGQSDTLLQPPPKQKRSSVACRRCRRLRAKCVKEEGGQGLCRGCIDAGVPNECQFLPRGMSAIDRARFSHDLQRKEKGKEETILLNLLLVIQVHIPSSMVFVQPVINKYQLSLNLSIIFHSLNRKLTLKTCYLPNKN